MDDFAQLAGHLNSLPVDPDAKISYDLFAGGLVWSDERPVMEASIDENGVPTVRGLAGFRALLNHRTSLILGESGSRWRDLWANAMTLCPNWPGFLPSRRDPALAEEYKARSEASTRSWEQMGARLEARQTDTLRTTKV